ncbi:MAG: ribbon-helix-helix protein, CopG family [Gemmatimonadaceae bacterium]
MPSRKKRYSRIAITLPLQDLAAADRLARAQDRSRSWIVAEAIRCYATASEGRAADDATGATPRRPNGLGASRLAQLTRDLTLTPEARVREAEETLRLTESREQLRAHRVVTFDRYDDYVQWKRQRDQSA